MPMGGQVVNSLEFIPYSNSKKWFTLFSFPVDDEAMKKNVRKITIVDRYGEAHIIKAIMSEDDARYTDKCYSSGYFNAIIVSDFKERGNDDWSFRGRHIVCKRIGDNELPGGGFAKNGVVSYLGMQMELVPYFGEWGESELSGVTIPMFGGVDSLIDCMMNVRDNWYVQKDSDDTELQNLELFFEVVFYTLSIYKRHEKDIPNVSDELAILMELEILSGGRAKHDDEDGRLIGIVFPWKNIECHEFAEAAKVIQGCDKFIDDKISNGSECLSFLNFLKFLLRSCISGRNLNFDWS